MFIEKRGSIYLFFSAFACALLMLYASAFALPTSFTSSNSVKLAQGEFVLDLAGMLSPSDRTEIEAIASALFNETSTIIYVVTIGSIAQYAGPETSIESLAHDILYSHWGKPLIAQSRTNWPAVTLLLVARDNRKARITFLSSSSQAHDIRARKIMHGQIISRFKDGKFSTGILAGVRAIDQVTRKNSLPFPYWSKSALYTVGAILIVLIFPLISFARHGRSSFFWLWGSAAFIVIIELIRSFLGGGGHTHPNGHDGGGGSQGSGGSSGGGATGSW